MYDVLRTVRTVSCVQLQGDLVGAALGLTRYPGAGGNRVARLALLQQITGGWHGLHSWA